MDTEILMTMTDADEEFDKERVSIILYGRYDELISLLAEGLFQMSLGFEAPVDEVLEAVVEEIYGSMDE